MTDAFDVRVHRRWGDAPAHWRALARDGGATPFQSPAFLDAWYATFCRTVGVEPVLVELTRGGEPAMLLPLARDARRRPVTIGFADCGVADNGAPILGPAAPATASEARAAWRAVRAALPKAELLRLSRGPLRIGERPNPLALLPRAAPSVLGAHVMELPETWEAYVRSRSKHFRKEQARVQRVFERHEGARFKLIDQADEASRVFAAMETLQRDRLVALGIDYRLDEPDIAAFYAELVRTGVGDGSVALGALLAGDEVVAALLGIANATTVTMVRLAHAGGEWRKASPGRLVIEKTIEALHGRGVRRIDLSIGSYDYKDDFVVRPEPLIDVVEPLRLSGVATALVDRAKARLRGTALHQFLRPGPPTKGKA